MVYSWENIILNEAYNNWFQLYVRHWKCLLLCYWMIQSLPVIYAYFGNSGTFSIFLTWAFFGKLWLKYASDGSITKRRWLRLRREYEITCFCGMQLFTHALTLLAILFRLQCVKGISQSKHNGFFQVSGNLKAIRLCLIMHRLQNLVYVITWTLPNHMANIKAIGTLYGVAGCLGKLTMTVLVALGNKTTIYDQSLGEQSIKYTRSN